MDAVYTDLAALSPTKPLAVLEFGAHEGQNWSKADWITDAYSSLASGRYPRVKAISWWNENWEDSPGNWSLLAVDSSPGSLQAYRVGIANSVFVSTPKF